MSSAREKRKANQKSKIDDVFGDFFGFGQNPPGCMKKDMDKQPDWKKEKAKFIAQLKAEIKEYDLQGIQDDMDNKIEDITLAIKKEEKIIMNEEDKQLRQVDKLHYMYEYLEDDNKACAISKQ